jgi:hypothetical protein
MVPKWSRIKSPAGSRVSFLALAGTVAGFFLAGVPSALPVAAVQAATATTCPETTLVQPFVKTEEKEKLTPGYYSLVAGGDFEAGEAAWTLSGGAKVASGGAKSPLTEKEGKSSLDLPDGASAQSPLTCVETNDRTFRFLDRSEGTAATVTVRVVYETALGSVAVVVGTLAPGASWEPSPILHSGAAVAAAIKGGVAHMSIRFTSSKGTARIDDVYLDPRMR